MYLNSIQSILLTYIRCTGSPLPDVMTTASLPSKSEVALLDWKTVQHGLPWNVILLLGGGMAMADAVQVL